MGKVKIKYNSKLKNGTTQSGWTKNGVPIAYGYKIKIKDKSGIYRTYQLNSDGTKTLLTKPAPNPTILYNNLWQDENPTKKGFNGNRYKSFNTKVKYSKNHELLPYSNDGYQHDVGAGINVEALKASNKKSDNMLGKKADAVGLSQQEVDSLMYNKINQNLDKVNEALKPYTQLTDTVSPQIKLGLADLRYQAGSLGQFPKLLEAVAKGDLQTIHNENRVKTNNKGDSRRQNIRNERYFYYNNGGILYHFKNKLKVKQ